MVNPRLWNWHQPDKHKHMYLEYADEILTSYLFFNMLILFNLVVIYGWKNEVTTRSWNLLFHFQRIGSILKDIAHLVGEFQTRPGWLTVFSGHRSGGLGNYELRITNYENTESVQ